MSPDLQQEYNKFKEICAREQMNASELEAKNMSHRLALIKERFEKYSEQGLSLDDVRAHEQQRMLRLKGMNEFIQA